MRVIVAYGRHGRNRGASAHFLQLVAQGGLLDTEEQGLVFGESLRKGLRFA